MFGLGGLEIAAIVVVALLLFGKKLPNVAKNAGKSLRGFKDEVTKAVTGDEDEEEVTKKKKVAKKSTTKAKVASKKK